MQSISRNFIIQTVSSVLTSSHRYANFFIKLSRRVTSSLLIAILLDLNLSAAESFTRVHENLDLGWKFFRTI
jgi:hypothetical protein